MNKRGFIVDGILEIDRLVVSENEEKSQSRAENPLSLLKTIA
jgi:hypothetical protein